MVRVHPGIDQLEIRVTDQGHACPNGAPARRPSGNGTGAVLPDKPGRGIPGMRERCQLLGGELNAAPTPDGGFEVMARLPLAPTGSLL
jgi:signal transduction histidine kinase